MLAGALDQRLGLQAIQRLVAQLVAVQEVTRLLAQAGVPLSGPKQLPQVLSSRS